MRRIRIIAFVEGDDQERILESRTCQQRSDIDGQLLIGGNELLLVAASSHAGRTIVRVVVYIGDDECVVRQTVIRYISAQLRERDDVRGLAGAVLNVGKINKGIMVLKVSAVVASQIPDRWQRLGIALPCLARRRECPHHVILRLGVARNDRPHRNEMAGAGK